MFEVTHETRFTEFDFVGWPVLEPVLGEITGPVDVHLTFRLDTEAAPVIHYARGSAMHGGTPAVHDFYGYDISAVSDLSVGSGAKSWDTEDLWEPNYSIGEAAARNRCNGVRPVLPAII